MDKVLDFTRELVIETGKTLLGYFQTSGIAQKIKKDRTVVTEADITADELIRKRIQERFPQDGILSEEENTIYPHGKRYVWVIDPLDGTTNFSLGLHYWGVLITRLRDGMPDITALYFPLLEELFMAIKGRGGYLNEQPLQIDANNPTRKATFFSCCSRTFQNYYVEIPYKTRILGAAGYGLSTIARGSAEFALEVTPKIWDFAGSWLLTQEAGGYIAPLEGGSIFPLQPGVDYQTMSQPLLVATTEEQWHVGRQWLHPKSEHVSP